MRKRSIRIALFVLVIIFIIMLLLLNDKPKEKVKEENKIDLVDVVYDKLKGEDINKEFIIWIDGNYEDSLNRLSNLLENNKYDKSMWHSVTGNSYIILNDLYNKKYENMDNVKIIESKNPSTLSFVGDVSLADNWFVIPKYEERNKGIYGILSKEVVDIMTNSDLMVVNSEFTVSNRGEALNKTYTFKAKPERLSIYYEMGVDLVTLANNHVYDYGREAFLDMLDAFDEYKIPRIGAGRNLDEASEPYYFVINGYKIAFLNATRAEKNIMTPGATIDSEGVFRCYDPTNMVNKIKEIRKNSDYVIVIIHYGKENSHELEKKQVESSKMYIDAGADVIVGHHAHTLQGVEYYNGKPIIYNLGNFIFNDEIVDTAIFQIVLNEDGIMDYYILPAIQKDVYTDILNGSEKERVINDLNSWSINAYIDKNGKIIDVNAQKD